MIDINKITEEINNKCKNITRYNNSLQKTIELLKDWFKTTNFEQTNFILNKLPDKNSKSELLLCYPTRSNSIYEKHKCSNIEEYSVVAVDGSNTDIDRHNLILYYLLNIALVEIDYNKDSSSFFHQTQPFVFIDEDVISQKSGYYDIKSTAEISKERQTLEFRFIKDYVNRKLDNDRVTIVLFDGNLINWAENRQDNRFGRKPYEEIEELFKLSKNKNIVICGFISSPKNTLLSNLYRVNWCPYKKLRCQNCEESFFSECIKYSKIKDWLFFDNLNEGEYTTFFYSFGRESDILFPTDVVFTYLNTGNEIARIELPAYLLDDNEKVQRVISAIFHQTKLGFGYPISLTHAHNLSTITNADKKTIEGIIYSVIENNLPFSSKKINKLNRII
ncbi:DNA double-strand break repair nuclease NurA [Caldicellulosiruptoraceae bacterium PP1]